MTATRVPAPPRGGAPGPVAPDPPSPDGSEGGGGGWAFLMTASGAIEAQLVRGYLESAGVPVALDLRDPSPGAWMFLAGNPRALVKVFVPAGMLDRARLELLEAGLLSGETAGPAAPEPPRRRPRLWLVLAILSVIVAAWIVLLQTFGSATCVLRMVC